MSNTVHFTFLHETHSPEFHISRQVGILETGKVSGMESMWEIMGNL